MSSVLHPVGPEPEQTYWVRRALVIGAAILVLIVVIAIVVSQNSSGSVVAQPTSTIAGPTTAPPPYTPTPTPSPTPTTASTSASAQATAAAKANAKVTAKASASAKPTASAKPNASAKASPTTSAKSSAKAKTRTTAKPPAQPTGQIRCPAAKLRQTLTGDQTLKPKQQPTFALSLINGSGSTCTLTVDGINFELRIYSGKDRIWSSNDCASTVQPVSKSVAKEEALEWKIGWNGRRSKAGCQNGPTLPKTGSYVVTAQYDGASPVELKVKLHA